MTNNKGKHMFHDQLIQGTFEESSCFVCSSFSCQVICLFMEVLFFSINLLKPTGYVHQNL
jgi:hypothetical protein